MARPLSFSHQSHHLKSQVLVLVTRKTPEKHLNFSLRTHISSPIFPNTTNKNSHIIKLYYNNSYVNKNALHVRRFSSISTPPLPTVLNSHHSVRKSCLGSRVPCLSLLPLFRSRTPSTWVSLMSSHSDDSPITNDPQDCTKTVRCVIKGRVQGVFYRNWTVENATQLGLKGWVRNRRDGSVEALFSGKPEVVDDMVQRCRRGPPDAMVTSLQATPCNEEPGAGFQRKPTV